MNRVLVFIVALLSISISHAADKEKAANEKEITNAEVYSKRANELGVLQNKIIALEKTIREQLAEKNKATDKEKVKEHVVAIKKGLKDRAETILKYNKEYNFIRYELPHKGKDFDKRYKRFDEARQKVFEDEINQSLSEVLNNINEKYNN